MAERGARLRVDPVACDGVGICAHLAPDLIGTDSWGYPVVSGDRLDAERLRQGRAAVRACPRRALFLDQRQAAAKAAGP